MQRRNFILGLGAAATLSGAASVTGAAFANEVSSTGANFRVLAEANLNVAGARDETVTGTGDGGDNNGIGYVSGSGIDFTSIGPGNTGDLPVAYADGSTNSDDLAVELAFVTDDEGDQITPVLNVQNNGDTDEDIGVTFEDGTGNSGFATPVSSGSIAAADVIEAITFQADTDDSGTGDTQISPNSSTFTSETDQEPANFVSVGSGETLQVDIEISNVTDAFVSGVGSEAGDQDPFAGGLDDIALVDAVTFGTESTT